MIRKSSGSAPGSGWPGGGRGSHSGGGTLLYNAVFLACNELMTKQSGRKAIIILTEGVNQGSKEMLQSALKSAQRADTIVYSILFKDNGAYSGGKRGFGGMGGPIGGGMGRHGGEGGHPQENRVDGRKILEQMSRPTGGRLFEVSKKLPVDQIYAQIEEELRTQYNLGYTPARALAAKGGYHTIQVSIDKKDLTVQARDGYYSKSSQ
jgi:VWFA-related protein